MPILNRLVLWALALLLTVPTAWAQDTDAPAPRPRIGLVLSGGAARGLAHIGVIEVLEEVGIPIDLITGTSMGGLVGGLYAAGMSTRELRDLAASQDWSAVFGDRVDRRLYSPDRRAYNEYALISVPIVQGRLGLPGGVIRGDRILRLLQRQTWHLQPVADFTALPIPFITVGTDLESGAAVPLTSGNLAEALRATMAIPGVFEPVEIDGQLLVDGGVVRNLPAEEARGLGAEILICSDVSNPLERAETLRSVGSILMQTITLQLETTMEPQRALCDVILRPDVSGLSIADFASVDSWIERGRAAVETSLTEILEFVPRGRPRVLASTVRGLDLADGISISHIQLEGAPHEDAARVIDRALSLSVPARITGSEVDAAVARLYATNLFSRISYRLDTAGGDTTLVVSVTEGADDRLGVGLRYDDHRNTALLFTASVHNWLSYGSATHLSVRLGEETQFAARYFSGRDVVSAYGLGATAQFTRARFALRDEGRPTTFVEPDIMTLTGIVGRSLSRTTVSGLQFGFERVDSGRGAENDGMPRQATYYMVGGLIWRDSFDRVDFPTHGITMRVQAEWGDHTLKRVPAYSRQLLDIEQILRLGEGSVLRARAIVGGGSGTEIPIHHHFFLGGAYPSTVFAEVQPAFWGLRPQERRGRSVQVLRLAVQRELREEIFLTVGGNIGNTFDEWTLPRNYLFGWGLALGAATLLGPVEVTLHGRSLRRWPRLDLNVGFIF